MVLTERQKKDLHESILEYLLSEGDTFKKTVEAFKQEGQLSSYVDTSKGLLEKKWTSVVRLQKKIMDLEAQLAIQVNKGGGPSFGDASNKHSELRMLPSGPAKSVMVGHRAPITAIVTHPTFTLLCTGSEDATIKIWDFETSQYERTLKGHTGPVTGLAYDSTGNLLTSCSGDMSAKLWDMTTFACTKTFRGHDHTLSAIRFTLNNDHVLTCSRDSTLKCWDVTTGFCTKTLTGHTDWVKCLCVSLDGTMIASGGTDHVIIVWKWPGGQVVQTLRGHEHVVESVSFGRRPLEAQQLVAASLAQSSASTHANAVNESSINGSSTGIEGQNHEYAYLASGSRDRSVRLWDALQGQCLMVFTAHDSWVRTVIVHPSGKYIVSVSDDKSIRVLDIKEGRCLRTIGEAHAHFITCAALSYRHATLVTGSVDKNIGVWTCS